MIAWNKGLIKETDKRVKKYANKLKGRHMIHKLTKEESDEKWKALFMYRLIAEEDYIRMNPYEYESCKRVR